VIRHFLRLYALVVIAIAGVSWAQEQLWFAYSNQAQSDKTLSATLNIVQQQLKSIPRDNWEQQLELLSDSSGVRLELFAIGDVTGSNTLNNLASGGVAELRDDNESWLLKQLDDQSILALQHTDPETQRGLLEWLLALFFYSVIALVVMVWLWPLTRDLSALEKATASFGDRNWLYRADIKPGSQIFPLAQTFRRMAARIDGLIGSHKDMSNAVSHEIKTPLSRMQFELELAQNASSVEQVQQHMLNVKADIADLNALIRATLDYAILERADMALNLAAHDFTKLIPAISDYVRRDVKAKLDIECDIQSDASAVVVDAHLMEAALKNLLYNASRYAKSRIVVTFNIIEGVCHLTVDDDGPGVPTEDRERVFGSFVQLDGKRADISSKKTGFGLGLAIVKRAIEWHDGRIEVLSSPLGGARFAATWPVKRAPR